MFGVSDFYSPIVDFQNFEASQLVSALGFGGAILLIGMATIFAVLILLWLCLVIFKFFMHDLPARRAESAKNEPTHEEAVQPVAQTASNDEIIAVIAAAIAMAESECSDVKFKVVSFKRK